MKTFSYILLSTLMLIVWSARGCSTREKSGIFSWNDTGDAEMEQAFKGFSMEAIRVQTGVRHTLPVFDLCYDDASNLPDYGERLSQTLMDDCRDPLLLLHDVYSLLCVPAGGYGPPLASVKQQVDSSGPEITGLSFPGNGFESWMVLPPEVRNGILEVMLAMVECNEVMDQFSLPIMEACNTEIESSNLIQTLKEPWGSKQLSDLHSVDLPGVADLRKLSYASRLMVSVLSGLIHHQIDNIPENFQSCIMETSLGRIGIFGKGRDTIEGNFCLLMDFGGDDLYTGNIASPEYPHIPVSITVDYAGNDSYCPAGGSLVASNLGLGMLVDLAGDDLYRSDRPGMGSAFYGTAFLFDLQGDDRYFCGSDYSLGSAHIGAGILADLDGTDTYRSGNRSQGYGGTLGIGLLLDRTGSDRYNSPDSAPSFVLGASSGRWAVATDGHSLGGGLGILVDGDGSDHYFAGSFSQGAAYFTGSGLFFDLKGDDHHDALSHSQGYGAHYAIGCYSEHEGDDIYNENSDLNRITQIMGSGRDLSIGWFLDRSGDDIYHFGNQSAGVGDLEGTGILWDQQGKDTYHWHQNPLNPAHPSMGQTLRLSEGMGVRTRLIRIPQVEHRGIFWDDQHKRKHTIIHE